MWDFVRVLFFYFQSLSLSGKTRKNYRKKKKKKKRTWLRFVWAPLEFSYQCDFVRRSRMYTDDEMSFYYYHYYLMHVDEARLVEAPEQMPKSMSRYLKVYTMNLMSDCHIGMCKDIRHAPKVRVHGAQTLGWVWNFRHYFGRMGCSSFGSQTHWNLSGQNRARETRSK